MKYCLRFLCLSLCAILAACKGGNSGNEPSRSDATTLSATGGGTFNADQTTLDITVSCDGSWSAEIVDGKDWASIASTDKNDKGGTVHVSMDINEKNDFRSADIQLTAGKLTRKVHITQKGISSVIDKTSLRFDGIGEQSLTVNTQSSWTLTVVDGDSWLSATPASGNAGETRVTVSAKTDYLEKGSRSASIRFSIAGKSFTVTVLQGQTNFLDSDAERTYKFDQAAGTLELHTRTNVGRPEVKVDLHIPTGSVESPGLWLKHLSTKAVDEHTHTFSIAENDRTYTRSADIIFSIDNLTDTVTVSQKGIDPLTRISTIGAYDVQGENWLYRPGTDLLSRLYSADGKTVSVRIINAADVSVIEMSGIPVDVKAGDACTIGFSFFQSGKTLLQESYTATAFKVGASEEEKDLVWFRQEDGPGFIIKK